MLGFLKPSLLARQFFVIQSGLIASALVFVAAYFVNRWFHIDVMGIHYEFILPVGAIGMGVVAAIGYVLAALWRGVRAGWGLTSVIVVLQILAYFAVDYAEFRQHDFVYADTGRPVGYFDYLHVKTLGLSFSDGNAAGGKSLGWAGYGVIGLEVLGFALPSIMLRYVSLETSYCQACGAYRKFKTLGTLAATEADTEVGADDEEPDTPLPPNSAAATYERLLHLAVDNNAEEFSRVLSATSLHPTPALQLTYGILVSVQYCPCCYEGTLLGQLRVKHGDRVRVDSLGSITPSDVFIRHVVG